MSEKIFEEKVPKIKPLRGYLREQYIKCGRSNCHCASSNGHGPYFYRVITTNGRKRKEYVRKSDLAAIQAGIDKHRQQRAEARRINQEANDYLQMIKTRLRQIDRLLRSEEYQLWAKR